MFFYLSKTVYFFLMPLGWITILLLISVWIKKPILRKRLRTSAIILAVIFTNQAFSTGVINQWEAPPIPLENITPHDVAIVLTGVANNRIQPQDRVYFNKGADRVLHTAKLFHEKKVKKIIISGGSGAFIKPDYSEAETLKRAFLELGVPDSVLLLEENSRNTHQSALNIRNQFAHEWKNKKVLLITSSFHLPRAQRCFEKEGIEITVFPVDFYGGPIDLSPDLIIPSPHALSKWHIIIHEIIGIIAYKIMGYI